MKILAVIPARGGSKGILRKNIRLLGGKPLLAYTIDSAKKSRLLSRIILSSDDSEIIEVAQNLGLEVPFVRPVALAQDETPSVEVIKHALLTLQDAGCCFEAVCLLQPTTPFRKEDLIDNAIKKFIEGKYDSLISVREVPHHFNPHWVFEENDEGELKIATGDKEIISRRQELPRAYHRDGAIYITKTEVLESQNSFFGSKIGYILSEEMININIDNLNDWDAAESHLNDLRG